MSKRIAISVLSGLILFGAGAYAWIWHGVRDCGFAPVNEQVYRQAVDEHRDR